jgi:hypothetical protein
MNLFGYVFNNTLNWIDPWGLARIITRPIKGVPGRHAYIRFDDGTTMSLNRVPNGTGNGRKTYVGPEAMPLSPAEEAIWGKDAGVCDAALKDSANKAKDADNPDADDVDGWPYDSGPGMISGPGLNNKGTNNSNDWVNRRLIEAGGKALLDWRGGWLK